MASMKLNIYDNVFIEQDQVSFKTSCSGKWFSVEEPLCERMQSLHFNHLSSALIAEMLQLGHLSSADLQGAENDGEKS